MSEKLPIRVGQRILVVNKARESAANLDLAEQFADLPALRVGVQVPFDDDLADRSYRGEPIDESAGLAARQAISELTRECLAPASGPRNE